MKPVSLAAVEHEVLAYLLGTKCYASAGLTIGTGAATKVKIANTVPYSIGGIMYSKATAEIDFTDTTVQAVSTTKYYTVCLDAAGDGLIVNGEVGDTVPPLPPSTLYCPIGYVKLVTDATGTFVPATDDLSDAAVTDTYYNVTNMVYTP